MDTLALTQNCDHTPGSSGEWAGRCTKCGATC